MRKGRISCPVFVLAFSFRATWSHENRESGTPTHLMGMHDIKLPLPILQRVDIPRHPLDVLHLLLLRHLPPLLQHLLDVFEPDNLPLGHELRKVDRDRSRATADIEDLHRRGEVREEVRGRVGSGAPRVRAHDGRDVAMRVRGLFGGLGKRGHRRW